MQLAGGGVKDTEQARFSTSCAQARSADILEGCRCFAQKQRQHHARMLHRQRTQLRRQGEGQQKIRHRQQAPLFLCAPLCSLRRPAIRAEPMVAGMKREMIALTFLAAIAMSAQRRSAARAERAQRLALIGRES